MAAADGDDSLYPIAVLIDELRNEDVQVRRPRETWGRRDGGPGGTGDPRGEGSVFAGSGGRGRRPISVQLLSVRVPGTDETAPGIGGGLRGGRERGPLWRVPGLPQCARLPGAEAAAARQGVGRPGWGWGWGRARGSAAAAA